MEENVDEVGAHRGEELTTTQPMASTTPLSKKHSIDILTNETLQ